MERKLFQIVAGLTWLALALPLTALNYWRAWDRLPMRVAVHFDVNWQPSGWTSREGALMFALGTTTFLLVIFHGRFLCDAQCGHFEFVKIGGGCAFLHRAGFCLFCKQPDRESESERTTTRTTWRLDGSAQSGRGFHIGAKACNLGDR